MERCIGVERGLEQISDLSLLTNLVIKVIYRRPKGGFLILWPSRTSSWSGVLYVAGVTEIENYAITRVIRDLTEDLSRFVDNNSSREQPLSWTRKILKLRLRVQNSCIPYVCSQNL